MLAKKILNNRDSSGGGWQIKAEWYGTGLTIRCKDPFDGPFGNPDPALLRYAGGTPMTDVWFINKSLPHFDYATWRFVTNTLKQHLPGERIQWCK